MLGNTEPQPDPNKYKLNLAYEAVEHWKQSLEQGTPLEHRKDLTIANQIKSYRDWRQTDIMMFTPNHSEDYPQARAFGLITPEEGESRWLSLRFHESDRIQEMEYELNQEVIKSADHRIVMAIAMLRGQSVTYTHPEAVNKSCPGFWKILNIIG